MLTFDGDVAIVTGAGRGLGRCHALELARRGARVVVNDLAGDSDPAATVVEEINAAGGNAIANHDNIATAEGGERIVQHALDEFGSLAIVVNNAGILRDKAFHNLTPDLVEAVFLVHLTGAFNVSRPAWRHLRAAGYGRVVNTTSASGLFGNFGQANYGAAKAGLVGLTRSLAVEGRKVGINVNAISPMASTRMTQELLGENGELLAPEQVSPVVAYLCHRECRITGQVLSVGGGHVSAVVTSVTRGITDPDLSAESVRDRLDEILDRDGAIVPRHLGDELKMFVEAIRASQPA
ncbi:MAG: short-chain dehydrogenase [Actinobacteria bacterium 13_1_20CM_2_65_11]|nr:MAG: short-chain dehydrogenase [Actinobacteria bacterium 13_1_20CM_2_65_11]